MWFLITLTILFLVGLIHFDNVSPPTALANSTIRATDSVMTKQGFTDNGESQKDAPLWNHDSENQGRNAIPPATTTTPTVASTPPLSTSTTTATTIQDQCECTENGQAKEIRAIYPSEWGAPHPAGLSYSLDRNHLILLSESSPDQSPAVGPVIVIITPYEDMIGMASLSFFIDNAINITYDEAGQQLLLLNNEQAELARVFLDQEGVPIPNSLTHINISHLGLNRADGLVVEPNGQRLFILDSGAAQIVIADAANDFELLTKTDLSYLNAPSLRGIAVHPVSHNLFTVDPLGEVLYELTTSGQLVKTYNLEALELTDPGGLAFGPSADMTDDPDTIHLFIADSSQLSDETSTIQTKQLYGRILEVDLLPGTSRP